MIIGSAKVLAEECGFPHFTIATPHIETEDFADLHCDEAAYMQIGGHTMMIGIKELTDG